MWQSRFVCMECESKYCLRLGFRFTYKPDIIKGKMKIVIDGDKPLEKCTTIVSNMFKPVNPSMVAPPKEEFFNCLVEVMEDKKPDIVADIQEDGVVKEEFDDDIESIKDLDLELEILKMGDLLGGHQVDEIFENESKVMGVAEEEEGEEDLETEEIWNVEVLEEHADEVLHQLEIERPWWDPLVPDTIKERGVCHLCNMSFPSWVEKRTHFKQQHGHAYDRLCEMCGLRFPTEGKYLNHFATHFPSIQKYSCEQCNKEFPYKFSLMNHMKRCQKPAKPYLLTYFCHFCNRSYKNKWLLRDHIQVVHFKQFSVYECTECSYKTRTQSYLVSHIENKHTNNGEHQCPKCDKKFSRKNQLKQHVRMHSEARPFICELCGRGYKHAHDLRNHKYVHTGELPYECQFCKKKFQDKGNKNSHVRTKHASEWLEFKEAQKLVKLRDISSK